MNIRHYLPKVIAITAIAMLAAASSCFGTVLGVPQYNQEKNNWCWCASAQMVLAYYGASYSQTTIAAWAVQGRDIANYLYGSPDSSMHGDDEILTHFGSLSSSGLAYAMSLSTLTSEINAGRPPMIRWGWNGGGGHIVVAYGTSGSTVYVRDPWYGNTINTYDYVLHARNAGTWTHTLKLNSSVNAYYSAYQYYWNYVNYYASRYNSTRSYVDLYYCYYYYAYAGYYYYLSYGQSSNAVRIYYYYMCYANYALANYHLSWYYYTGRHVYAGYYYYYAAWNNYYGYLYNGDSYNANRWYGYYMYYANWWWSH